jgi:hypothetical protein
MSIRQRALAATIAIAAVVSAVGCNRTETLTPEQAAARGDAMLREMSKNAGTHPAFSYTATERREVVQGSTKTEKVATRRVTIRRPDRLTFTGTGEEADNVAWYDGKQVTLVSNRDKVWIRGPMPPTLDEALDYLSAEYAINMPSADLLYSNPYDALMSKDATGGWVDTQQVGDRTCDHLSYRQETIDWEIWLAPTTRLPCQIKITYKTEPGQPSTTVTYSDLDTSPSISEDTFTPKVPEGYERLKIMRHATVNDPKADEAAAAAAPAATK